MMALRASSELRRRVAICATLLLAAGLWWRLASAEGGLGPNASIAVDAGSAVTPREHRPTGAVSQADASESDAAPHADEAGARFGRFEVPSAAPDPVLELLVLHADRSPAPRVRIAVHILSDDEVSAMHDSTEYIEVSDPVCVVESDVRGKLALPKRELLSTETRASGRVVLCVAQLLGSTLAYALFDGRRDRQELRLPPLASLDFELRIPSQTPRDRALLERASTSWRLEIDAAPRIGGLALDLVLYTRKRVRGARQRFELLPLGSEVTVVVATELAGGFEQSFSIVCPKRASTCERRALLLAGRVTSVSFEIANARAQGVDSVYALFDTGDGKPKMEIPDCVDGRVVMHWWSHERESRIRRMLVFESSYSSLCAELACRIRSGVENDLGRIELRDLRRTIEGQVVDDRGAPLAAASVSISLETRAPRYRSLSTTQDVKADEAGRFVLTTSAYLPREACLVARLAGYCTRSWPLSPRPQSRLESSRLEMRALVLPRMAGFAITLHGYPRGADCRVLVHACSADGKLGRKIRDESRQALFRAEEQNPRVLFSGLEPRLHCVTIDFGTSGDVRGRITRRLRLVSGERIFVDWSLAARRFEFVSARPGSYFVVGRDPLIYGGSKKNAARVPTTRVVFYDDASVRSFAFREPYSPYVVEGRWGPGRHLVQFRKRR